MGELIMSAAQKKGAYRSTESKYKGGAQDMFVTYDLDQRTRSGGTATIPKVKRIYIAGDVKKWTVGDFTKRTGRQVYGLRIEYEQSRRGYRRHSYHAQRGSTEYDVPASKVGTTAQQFSQIVEIPPAARNVHFYGNRKELPDRFQHALQRVR
jgi:hypothetical protein